MIYRTMLLTNGVLIAGMAGLSIWAWGIVPDNAQIPIHWDFEGKVDRLGSKTEGLIAMPAMALIITALMWVIPQFDPRRANLEASHKFWNAVTISLGLFLTYLHVLLVMTALGRPIDMLSAMIPALSLLFVGIGNYMGKARSNWFGGVRTPWTMSSEYSWEKTHRITGRLFVTSGVIGLVVWFASTAKVALVVLLTSIIVTAVVSVLASYVYWRTDPARTSGNT